MRKKTLVLFSIILCLCCSIAFKGLSQDTVVMDSIYHVAISYADMDEDSMLYFDGILTKNYFDEDNYPIYHYRILGIYQDIHLATDSATYYFLKSIQIAEQRNNQDALSAVYVDLGGLYIKNKAYSIARDYFQKALSISQLIKNRTRISSCYNNLGILFRKQKMYDSAIAYYAKSLAIKQELKSVNGIMNVNTNIGSLYVEKGMPEKALPYFTANLEIKIANGINRKQLFSDYANIASAYIRLKNYRMFKAYIDTATQINQTFPTSSNLLALKNIWTAYYEELEDYKHAFIHLREQNIFQDSLMNYEAINTTTKMMEKYSANKREMDNKLLVSALNQQKLIQRYWIFAFSCLVLILSILIYFLFQRNKKNKMLQQLNQEIMTQHAMLEELNDEKNALISIVSHDLSNPFANIKLWNSVLATNTEGLDEDQLKAIQRIEQGIESGETMIKQILDVEKLYAKDGQALTFERINIIGELQKLIAEYTNKSTEKNTQIRSLFSVDPIFISTNKTYFIRIIENLLSNTFKYSMVGKQVFVNVKQEKNKVILILKDAGLEIAEEHLQMIFSKYGSINHRPSAGEQSTALSLSIVKRLADELGVIMEIKTSKENGNTIVLFFPCE